MKRIFEKIYLKKGYMRSIGRNIFKLKSSIQNYCQCNATLLCKNAGSQIKICRNNIEN